MGSETLRLVNQPVKECSLDMEVQFELCRSKRCIFVQRYFEERSGNECLVITIKHGRGSVTIWGCFGSEHNEILHRIEKIMTKKVRVITHFGAPSSTT